MRFRYMAYLSKKKFLAFQKLPFKAADTGLKQDTDFRKEFDTDKEAVDSDK